MKAKRQTRHVSKALEAARARIHKEKTISFIPEYLRNMRVPTDEYVRMI